MKKEIEIPGGYEAKIEGNKVVLVPKEIDDEKIRQAIVELVKWTKTQQGHTDHSDSGIKWDEMLTYLEKQKGPEWCHHKVDLSGCSEEYRKAYYDGWNNCNQQHSQLQAEQKPAEWVLPEDFEEAVYKVANFISPFHNQEELRKISHRFAEQLLSLAKKELDEPAEWSEEDQRMLERVINSQKHVIPVPGKKGLEDMTTREEEDTEAIKWLRELPLRIRPVQEWSKEDKTNGWTGVDLERYLNCLQRLGTGNPQQPETINSKWFKEHCRPQPKQKWNEEEQDTINLLIAIVENNFDHDKAAFKWRDGQYLSRDEVVNRIKSLRPQPHWKPSKEQMRALALFRSSGRVINSLYNDLKKL